MEDDDFDFGFSTIDPEEFTASERNVQEKLDKMYNAIMPLLNNLMKDSDTNEYIHWPNRKKRIQEFILKLDSIKNK